MKRQLAQEHEIFANHVSDEPIVKIYLQLIAKKYMVSFLNGQRSKNYIFSKKPTNY